MNMLTYCLELWLQASLLLPSPAAYADWLLSSSLHFWHLHMNP
jgi:hypothetical protein